MARTEDPNAIVDALAYVEELHQELTTENAAPPLGAQNQVIDAILADPGLTAYVRDWARRTGALEARAEPPMRPPIDDVYRFVRNLLLQVDPKAPR